MPNYFTILYWFCHTSTWIRHRCTRVPNPETPSHHPPHTIPLGHPSAPAPSLLYSASNLDWRFISYMILYMLQCHSPKSPTPPTESKRLFCTSVSLLMYHIQVYHYHLSKFHIYALVYCIGVFLSGICHINTRKDEKNNDHLNGCRKMFDKIQYPFMMKAINKRRIEENYAYLMKAVNEKPTANTVLTCETTLFS